jgi:hypothetical protein
MKAYTILLETREPFGPEVQVIHEESQDPRSAAKQALHDWHGTPFNANTKIEKLEDDTVRVLAVLEGAANKALTRSTSGKLV